MDIMATSPDTATLAEYKETAKELLGDDVSVSVVGLHRYAQTWHDQDTYARREFALVAGAR